MAGGGLTCGEKASRGDSTMPKPNGSVGGDGGWGRERRGRARETCRGRAKAESEREKGEKREGEEAKKRQEAEGGRREKREGKRREKKEGSHSWLSGLLLLGVALAAARKLTLPTSSFFSSLFFILLCLN